MNRHENMMRDAYLIRFMGRLSIISIGFLILNISLSPIYTLPLDGNENKSIFEVSGFSFQIPATLKDISNYDISLVQLESNPHNILEKAAKKAENDKKKERERQLSMPINYTLPNPFKPKDIHNFKNMIMETDDDQIDLKNKHGVLTGRFKINNISPRTHELLEYIAGNKDTNCDIKWKPKGGKNNDGNVEFNCILKLTATGYSGDTPLNIMIVGFSGLSNQNVHLNTNGFNFMRTYSNVDALKHDIMESLGVEPTHKCSIVNVNGKSFKSDELAFKHISALITKGMKQINIKVEPMIKLDVNIRHPFSKSSESYNYDAGFYSIKEYKAMLKSDGKIHDFSARLFGKSTDDYTLVGVNNKFTNIKGYKLKSLYKIPFLMHTVWTLTPSVRVNYYYLDTLVSSVQLPVQTDLLKAVKDGENLIKKRFKNVKKADYKLNSYSLPGCLEEEDSLYKKIKTGAVSSLDTIPVSDSCMNKNTDELNLFYLNDKPVQFKFLVEIFNPDGTLSFEKPVTLDYIEKAKLKYLKEHIVVELERDGHLVSPDDLKFIDLTTDDGEQPEDSVLISKFSNVIKEQKLGKTTHLKLKASPKLDAIFTNGEGKKNKFKVHLKSTHPTTDDIKNSLEDTLHERHLLKDSEHLGTKVVIHPMNKNHKVNDKININEDSRGYLPPGTKADEIAVEADKRVVIPVNFEPSNGKQYRFDLKVPYGSDAATVQKLILKKLKKNGYGDDVNDLHISINNTKDGVDKLWNNDLTKDRITLNVVPSVPVDVQGDVHGVHSKFTIRVHPNESMDELDDNIITGLKKNSEIDKWLKSDPAHVQEISTIVSDDLGKMYDDDDLNGGDVLYKNRATIHLGVADHPLDLIWVDPIDGSEYSHCMSKRKDGKCRGVPSNLLSKYSAQSIGDFLVSQLKKNGNYEKAVLTPMKKRKDLTSTVKLYQIRLVDGRSIDCTELQLQASLPLLHYLYGIELSNISALVYSLMTQEEYTILMERQREPKTHDIVLSKVTGDKESHVLNSGDITPEELKMIIYKHFHTVPFDSEIENILINGEPIPLKGGGKVLSEKLKGDGKTPVKITFGIKDDKPLSNYTLIDSVKIQPKYTETVREYFQRAMSEPGDYGLSPMHSYDLKCIDDKGKLMHIDNLLDVPVGQLKCKEIKFSKYPTVRSDLPTRIVMNVHGVDDQPMESLDLDESSDRSELNSKLRKFLLNIPEGQMGHVKVMIDGKPINCSLDVLREAYMIRHLTLDGLLDLCNSKRDINSKSIINLKLDEPYHDLREKSNYKLLNTIGNKDTPPIAHLTLQKGQHDMGLGSLIKISLGSLKSALSDFYNKLYGMFGDELVDIKNVSLYVVKNGKNFPCDLAKGFKSLNDIKKVTLIDLFKFCHITPHVPPNGVYLNFIFVINMGGYNNTSSIPVDIIMGDEDYYTTVNTNEDLNITLEDYVDNNPDIDVNNLGEYNLIIRGEDVNHNSKVKNYNMGHLPHNMTIHDVFPHEDISNINIELYNPDDELSSDNWSSNMKLPVEEFKNNFNDLKRVILLNLKAMHGDNLSKIGDYVVNVGINGVKHQCKINDLNGFAKMTMKEFMKKCVNIDEVRNNPSLSFTVGHDDARVLKKVNLKCVCGDNSSITVRGLNTSDKIPKELVDEVKARYESNDLKRVHWNVFINNIQADCHLKGISEFSITRILNHCGVDHHNSQFYNIVLQDAEADLYGSEDGRGPRNATMNVTFKGHDGARRNIRHSEDEGRGGGRNIRTLKIPGRHVTMSSSESPSSPSGGTKRIRIKSHSPHSPSSRNVHVMMPRNYSGHTIDLSGNDSLGDYAREIILDMDENEPGMPVNIKLYNNDGEYDIGNVPRRVYNYPSDSLNSKFSFVVKDDPTGNLQGTVTTIHLPNNSKQLSEFIDGLHDKNPHKRIFLVNRDSMLREENIPDDLLYKPVDELRKSGYTISLLNEHDDDDTPHGIKVGVIYKNGANESIMVRDLQAPLNKAFKSLDVNSKSKLRLLIDGYNVNCNVPVIKVLNGSMTLQNLLDLCGIADVDNDHNITIYVDNGKSNNNIKFNMNINGVEKAGMGLNYGADVNIGSDGNEFLSKNKLSHVYVDVKSDGYDDFIEVDSAKFRRLLNNHPDLISMLVKMGIPPDHLGGLHSLKLILSTLSNALEGHQKFNINNGNDISFNVSDPISKYPNVNALKDTLLKDRDLNVNFTVTLADNTIEEFSLDGKDFLHALKGNLTFRELALYGIDSEDAKSIKHLSFNIADVEGNTTEGTVKGRFRKRTGGHPPDVTTSRSPAESSSNYLSLKGKATPRDRGESSDEEGEENEDRQNIRKRPTFKGQTNTHTRSRQMVGGGTANKGADGRMKTSGGMPSGKQERNSTKQQEKLTLSSSLSSVFDAKMLSSGTKSVELSVKVKHGRLYRIPVKNEFLLMMINKNKNMKDLLLYFVQDGDLSSVESINIEVKGKSKSYYVPLIKHTPIAMPIIASDLPTRCMIQEFKNPWNPDERVWKNLTIGESINEYTKKYKINDKLKAIYLLMKEEYNNLSAQLIYSSELDDESLFDRKLNDFIPKGYTLFLRYRNEGELVD